MEINEKNVEAVLFAVGKEITSERLASLCSLTIEEVDQILIKMQKVYSERDHSLQIVKREEGWKLTVRDQFVPIVSNIVSSTELERPLMETLAVIAWKYPVVQSEIIKLRSPAAYDHMRLLEEQGFVAKEKFGRTFTVKLTKKFFEYFDLPSEEAKLEFLKKVPPEILHEAENVEKEADEVERLIELGKHQEESKDEILKATQEAKNKD